MKILNKRLTSKAQFRDYVDNLKFYPWFRPKRVVMHHTSSHISSWQNSASMLHYWNLYRSRGWKSGPHIFIAPSGIWLFTPLNKKGTTSTKQLNKDSIHIEIVGKYYDYEPIDDDICRYTAIVSEILLQRFNLSIDKFEMHYTYEGGENCSPHVGKNWIAKIWNKYL